MAEWKSPFTRCRRWWNANIKTYLKEIECEVLNWFLVSRGWLLWPRYWTFGVCK